MLTKWARKLHVSGASASQQSEFSSSSSVPEDRLPVLPHPRVRPITPPLAASNETSSAGAATSQFGVFGQIPFEIRQQILIDAFGEQIIHVDLVYGHRRNGQQSGENHKQHRFRRPPRGAKEIASASMLQKLKPKRWLWYSCVCHANLPTRTNAWSRFAEPCDDICGSSDVDFCCDEWPGQAPNKCSIGIIGWLLTCRQAYSEGMDVLWGTNTFRVQDMVILRQAHRLFLPHRWASIRRLEIQCFFTPYGWMFPATTQTPVNPLPPYCHRQSFYDLMHRLPRVLCNLQTLHLSLRSTTKRPFSDNSLFDVEELMKPVEGMLRQLPRNIHECTVAVPSSLYRPSRDKAKRNGNRAVEHFVRRQKERHWRELSGPTEGLEGYLMQLGKVDFSPFSVLPMPCFGGGADESWRDRVDIEEEDLILYGLHWL